MKLRYKVLQNDVDDLPITTCEYPTLEIALQKYREAVQVAKERKWHVGQVTLLELIAPTPQRGFGSITHKNWKRKAPEALKDAVEVRYGYKIHGFQTANGRAKSAKTDKFYESEDEALTAATNMVRRPNNKEAAGVVIYKAVKVIRAVQPPVEVETVDL